MKKQSRFTELLKEFETDPEYLAEQLRIDVIEQFLRIMEETELTRTEFARRLGCSKAYVTKLLNGTENLTLLKLVEIGNALGRQVEVMFVPLRSKLTKSSHSRKIRSPRETGINPVTKIRVKEGKSKSESV